MKINAVFEGGGVKGIALIGAVQQLEQHGYQFEKVAGTSSGALVASLLASGYRAEEMKQLILDTPFISFLKRSPIFNVRGVGPALRLFLKKGLYSGEYLEYWVKSILLKKGIRTFADLGSKKLQIIASDITQGKLLVLPQDIEQYGLDPKRLEIAKAVRMSTSIPYFFDPVMIRKVTHSNDKISFNNQFIYIVDGALLSNFPLWLFDEPSAQHAKSNIPTIGFQLVGKQASRTYAIHGPISMLQALFSTMVNAHDERYIQEHDWMRTIKIPTLGVHTTDFDLTKETSMNLYNAGQQAAVKFLKAWTKENYSINGKKAYFIK